jgi:hypothetical protein
MSKDYTDGKANLMEIIKQKEREKVPFILYSLSSWSLRRRKMK